MASNLVRSRQKKSEIGRHDALPCFAREQRRYDTGIKKIDNH